MSDSRDFKNLVLSSHFSFFVGPDHTCITVHRGLASGLSDPLNNLMNNGKMLESLNGMSDLKDVEVDTFVAFCEFAYKGSYTAPLVEEPESVTSHGEDLRNGDVATEVKQVEDYDDLIEEASPGEPEPPPEPPMEDEGVPAPDDWSNWAPTTKDKKKKKKSDSNGPGKRLLRSFLDLSFQEEPDPNPSPQPDKRPALTFHAKVYVFATYYLIKPLRDLSLSYLHQELCGFPVMVRDLQNIFELVEYTYTRTERGEAWGPQLRQLVAHYVACKADVLVRDDQMGHLMDTYGELGSDVVRLLVE